MSSRASRRKPLIVAGLMCVSTASVPAAAHDAPLSDPEYLVDVWETDQGLPEDSATAMVQTPDGYLWFGTFNGLVRFDGVKFAVFDRSNTPELPDPGIVNLHLDRTGRLWVSTLAGMAAVKDGRWSLFGEGAGWTGNYVRFFAEGASGELYMTTFDGKILRFRNDRFEEISPPPVSPKFGFVPHVDSSGELWVVHAQFIGKLAAGQWQEMIPPPRSSRQDPAAHPVMAGSSREGGLWIAERSLLRRFDRSGRLLFQTRPPFSLEGLWSLHEDSTGAVWICSHSSGVYRFTPDGRWRRFSTGSGLSYHGARFVFEDREGNTWIGTSGGGLNRFKHRNFTTWGLAQGLPERVVKSLAEDRRGRIVFGTHGQGVARLEGTTIRHVPRPGETRAITPLVLSTLVDRRDRLWVGSLAEGLHVVDGTTMRHFFTGPMPGATGSTVFSLLEDSGGRLWIGLDADVVSLEGERFRTHRLEGSPRLNSVRAFAEGPNGVIWAGTRAAGLYRLEGDRFAPVSGAKLLAGERISALLADEDGTLWIGTEDGGVGRFRNGALVRLSEREGLPARSISAILDDGLGNLWLGSNRGILRVPRTELAAVVDGGKGAIDGQVFNLSDGLPSLECTTGYQPSAIKARDGRLWFATLKGAVVVDPRRLRLNAAPTPALIEDVTVDGHPVGDRASFVTTSTAREASVTVPPGAKRLEIHYAGLSFTAPEKVRFRYMLDGLDRQWLDVGDRRVAYLQDLKPGSYRFRVKAANNDGLWNEAGATLALTVQPLVWQTLWFRLLALSLLIGATVLAATRVTRGRLKRQIELLRAEQAQREAEEKYRQIFENAVEGIFQTTPSGRFLAANPAMARILGYGSAEELVQSTVPIDRQFYADPDQRSAFKRAMEARDSVRGFTELVYRKDGTPIWISLNARVVRDASGAVLYYEGTAEDITERRQLQESLRKSETLSAMGSLVAGVAHEVRNPLFSISANLDAFEATMGTQTRFHPLVAIMRAEVSRLTLLMKELLDYGKPVQSLRSAGALDSVLADAVAACTTLASERGVDVASSVAQGLPPVSMDRERLAQAFQNLLQNAIQHSPRGGVVSLDAAKDGGDEGPGVIVTISDAGPGFLPEDLPRVFEPFFSRRRGGTGLGLAIVQRIVEGHGGTVALANHPRGRGATAIVRLPPVGPGEIAGDSGRVAS